MARRLASLTDEDGIDGPFERAMNGSPRRRAARKTAATVPTPVVETKAAPTTLETHLELLRRAEMVVLDGSWDERLLADIRAELAKWRRAP